MADKRCENGHFIDESWDLCPYCPSEATGGSDSIPVVRPSRFGSAAEAPRPDSQPRPGGPQSSRPEPAPPARPSQSRPLPPTEPPEGRRPITITPTSSQSPVERTVAVQKIDIGAAAKRYVVGWLVGLNGSARGESYAVRIGRNILGRDRRSDIYVNDDQASSHHADLVFRPDERRFILMDHNSTNGTYVNEVEIEPRRDLAAKDVVRIGSHKFIFMPLCHEGFYWDDEGALK